MIKCMFDIQFLTALHNFCEAIDDVMDYLRSIFKDLIVIIVNFGNIELLNSNVFLLLLKM